MNSDPQIALCYLLRAANGKQPVENFAQSYLQHPAGIPHRLVLICKGFRDSSALHEYRDMFRDAPCSTYLVSDHGFDISAYYKAARQLDLPFLCFVNSFTEILADQWLAALFSQAVKSTTGLAGATGSWESLYTNILLESQLNLPTSLLHKILRPLRLVVARRWFPPFPNPHIRTTGFMCRREVFLRVQPPSAWTKLAAMRFESGQHSFSIQVKNMGLNLVVVDRHGMGFPPEQWPLSKTFRAGHQEALMLADNRTRQFDHASAMERSALSRLAWGTIV